MALLLFTVGCGLSNTSCGASSPSGSTAPPAATERAIISQLQASQRAGFERHDLAAYLAAFAPAATLTVGRGPHPGPYDRSIDRATIEATRAERFHAPPPQPARLWWSEVSASVGADRAEVRWIAHSQTPEGTDTVAERYHLRSVGGDEPGRFLVVHNRLWPLAQVDADGHAVSFSAETWAERDAVVAARRCDGGPCPEALLAAWRFEEAWQAARALTAGTPPTHPQGAARWRLRGVCAVVSGRVADAAPSFVEALRRDPDLPLPPWRSAAAAGARQRQQPPAASTPPKHARRHVK